MAGEINRARGRNRSPNNTEFISLLHSDDEELNETVALSKFLIITHVKCTIQLVAEKFVGKIDLFEIFRELD